MVCCVTEFAKNYFVRSTLVAQFTRKRSGETIMRKSKGKLKLNWKTYLKGCG